LDFWNSFAGLDSVFEESDSRIIAVDAVELNAFLDFLDWAGVDWALRNSFQRHADFVFQIDQFVFQVDAFAAVRLIKFRFVFTVLFVGHLWLFPAFEQGFERSVFGLIFGLVFRFVGFVLGFVIIRVIFVPFVLERGVFRIEFSFEWFVFAVVLVVSGFVQIPFGFVQTKLALVASAVVEFSVGSPELAFVFACVEFIIEFTVLRVFSFIILTEEFFVQSRELAFVFACVEFVVEFRSSGYSVSSS